MAKCMSIRALALFSSAKRTMSARTAARQIDPAVEISHSWEGIDYTFSDGSRLLTCGRGRNHRIWAEGA